MKIGREDRVRISEDSWIGCIGNYRLSDPLVQELHALGITRLADVASDKATGDWFQRWKSAEDLNLRGEKEEEWTQCIGLLKHSAIVLLHQDDGLK